MLTGFLAQSEGWNHFVRAATVAGTPSRLYKFSVSTS